MGKGYGRYNLPHVYLRRCHPNVVDRDVGNEWDNGLGNAGKWVGRRPSGSGRNVILIVMTQSAPLTPQFQRILNAATGQATPMLRVYPRPPRHYQTNRLYDVCANGRHLIAKQFLRPDELAIAPACEFGALQRLALVASSQKRVGRKLNPSYEIRKVRFFLSQCANNSQFDSIRRLKPLQPTTKSTFADWKQLVFSPRRRTL